MVVLGEEYGIGGGEWHLDLVRLLFSWRSHRMLTKHPVCPN